jgi:hypothetical protein
LFLCYYPSIIVTILIIMAAISSLESGLLIAYKKSRYIFSILLVCKKSRYIFFILSNSCKFFIYLLVLIFITYIVSNKVWFVFF